MSRTFDEKINDSLTELARNLIEGDPTPPVYTLEVTRDASVTYAATLNGRTIEEIQSRMSRYGYDDDAMMDQWEQFDVTAYDDVESAEIRDSVSNEVIAIYDPGYGWRDLRRKQKPTQRYYVTMAWDNWPEGGTFNAIVDAKDNDDVIEQTMQQMAEHRADSDRTAQEVRDMYEDEWELIDCMVLEEFIARLQAQLGKPVQRID